ncbi:MAG TPA: SagB/ThcOx family dehydrogenase [Bacteroidales bacterium]|nr:SagB/ThcOx family dehydrogenase [Bacteroidales bacterium]
MKSISLSLLISIFMFSNLFAQELKDIKLPEPQKTGGKPLMETLDQRQTTRDFNNEDFSLQEISNLLWAAFGVNRADIGKRTAPSARNRQEVDIYIATKTGIYIYDAFSNKLKFIKDGDYRKYMGKQDFVSKAPIVLIYIADYSKLGNDLSDTRKAFYTGTSAGYISQNVYLFAASEGLATVVLGAIDHDKISEVLGLNHNQVVLLSQAIGYKN